MSSTSEPTPKPRRHQSLFVSGMCSLEMFWGRVPEASIPLVWRPQSCHPHTFTMHLVSVTGLHCFIFLRVVSIANSPDLHSYRRTAVRVAEEWGLSTSASRSSGTRAVRPAIASVSSPAANAQCL